MVGANFEKYVKITVIMFRAYKIYSKFAFTQFPLGSISPVHIQPGSAHFIRSAFDNKNIQSFIGWQTLLKWTVKVAKTVVFSSWFY